MAFEPGKSGNPDGRPPGPNKITMATRLRIAEECDPIGFLSSVMKGEPQVTGEGDDAVTHQPTLADRTGAARSLLGKLVPDAKDRPLAFEVGEITGPAYALACMGRVIVSMGAGDITPAEATSVMNVVSLYVKAWEANDLEQRLAALEAKA
ncbi:hypothetical protein [Brevundimonas sp. DC300-4]|uniref:hypothetical protein n=1 Tax=Brevundimonas sp. DC300-4 TaxID=2804594 RepID=UPI003CF1B701